MLVQEYLHLEPIGITLVFCFFVVVVIQFIAMCFHRYKNKNNNKWADSNLWNQFRRFGTISHILATTDLWKKEEKEKEEKDKDKHKAKTKCVSTLLLLKLNFHTSGSLEILFSMCPHQKTRVLITRLSLTLMRRINVFFGILNKLRYSFQRRASMARPFDFKSCDIFLSLSVHLDNLSSKDYILHQFSPFHTFEDHNI